jgi:hypothetical protein
MQELSMNEVEQVNGGLSRVQAYMALGGFAFGLAGACLTVAGLGTPVSIGGAALAFEGAAMMSVAFVGA